jgi:hypothetical protein
MSDQDRKKLRRQRSEANRLDRDQAAMQTRPIGDRPGIQILAGEATMKNENETQPRVAAQAPDAGDCPASQADASALPPPRTAEQIAEGVIVGDTVRVVLSSGKHCPATVHRVGRGGAIIDVVAHVTREPSNIASPTAVATVEDIPIKGCIRDDSKRIPDRWFIA